MIILHIAPIVTDTVNGLRFSVPGLIRSQIRQGQTVACMNIKHSDQTFDFDLFDFGEIALLPKPFDQPDVVIFHGVYWKEYLRLVRQFSCPYIIVPRSSLTQQAQQQRRLKKWLGNVLLFNRFINHSAHIHYLNQEEADQSAWVRHPYFIVPNGMDIPMVSREEKNDSVIRFATIGRYDLNHKGLDLLIEAISRILQPLRQQSVEFHFYGSDHKNNKSAFVQLVEKSAVEDRVFVHDAVYGQDKHEVLLSTDLFISTSRFEGHPMAVLEAMAYGIPCILTEGTHMRNAMTRYDAGWPAQSDPDSIAQAILLALNQKEQWAKKGNHGIELIKSEYSWEHIGATSIENYKKVLNSGKI
jgi:glycosyltransferase involved in cell wall biosynthesis